MKNSLVESFKEIQKRDIFFNDKYLSMPPFHSAYWSHRRLRKAIIANSHHAKGDLLDIGCGIKPYKKVFAKFVQKHWGLEYSPKSGYSRNLAAVYGDAAALPFIIQLGLFASGIITPIPEKWRWINFINPVAALIEAFRAACFGKPFNWLSLGAATVLTFAILILSAYNFRKMERSFADVI